MREQAREKEKEGEREGRNKRERKKEREVRWVMTRGMNTVANTEGGQKRKKWGGHWSFGGGRRAAVGNTGR